MYVRRVNLPCIPRSVQMPNKHTDVLLGFPSLPGMSAPVKRL